MIFRLRHVSLLLIGLCLPMPQTFSLDIIGHRGASYDAPENTLAALKLSFDQGADGTELDIHLTKDGNIAVIHDYDLKRSGGADLKVAETTLAELQKFNVGNFGKWKDRGFSEKVPALSEVFPLVPPGKRLFIEIKARNEIVPALVETLTTSKISPRQLPIITFHYEVAKAVKEKLPQHEVSWLHGWR